MITGFQSPAQGYEDKTINLNSLLIKHPCSTFLMEIKSNKYVRMSIYDGDLLIIDRSKTVHQNSLVVYEQEGVFELGRVFNIKSKAETVITGVVVHVIHTVKEI